MAPSDRPLREDFSTSKAETAALVRYIDGRLTAEMASLATPGLEPHRYDLMRGAIAELRKLRGEIMPISVPVIDFE